MNWICGFKRLSHIHIPTYKATPGHSGPAWSGGRVASSMAYGKRHNTHAECRIHTVFPSIQPADTIVFRRSGPVGTIRGQVQILQSRTSMPDHIVCAFGCHKCKHSGLKLVLRHLHTYSVRMCAHAVWVRPWVVFEGGFYYAEVRHPCKYNSGAGCI